MVLRNSDFGLRNENQKIRTTEHQKSEKQKAGWLEDPKLRKNQNDREQNSRKQKTAQQN
jgi:hypothetical protein